MKIICIGNNYIEHIKELNNTIPESPVFFLKPDTALVINNNNVYYPEHTNDFQYEAEIVLKISKRGKYISELFANKYFNQITIGIDFTARDIQSNCKVLGLPWEIAKAFDSSAPIGKFIDIKEINNINNLNFSLRINDKIVQKGNTANMIFKPSQIISYVSKFITLKEGDLIFTGTPVGVGPVKLEDKLCGFIEGKELLSFKIK